MGIRHAGRRNIEYILLQNKKIEEIVSIDNVQYTVQTIIDRYIHAFQFAINILRKVPEQANFLVIEMDPNTFNPTSLGRILEETMEKFRKRFGETSGNPLADLLEIYHFRNGETGLPIDALCSRTYDNYIKVIRFLLYTEKQALYAGKTYNDIPLLPEEKIVLTLPTLVLLGTFKALNLLEPVKESITNKERTELKIYETVEMETLLSAGNIDKCQLDCMILAQKSKAIYLSDDLFFRKLANAIGLKNVNLTWLLRYMGNLVRTQKIIKEIRETNYLTT